MKEDAPLAHRILVVEDNPADVYLIKSALEEHGIDSAVEVVSDGERARTLAREFQDGESPWPDLVLLDINLPKIDGLELLQRLSSAPCPIIVMSSSQSPTDRQQAIDRGAACYFWKPTDLDGFLHLGEIVRDLLQRKLGHHGS